jgi:AcrR family transcriptional regulator
MKADTRARLIQAAARLFAENGYRGASVRDICNQAGANPGAVSYHFGGKRQLYRTVLRQAAEELAAATIDDGNPPEPEVQATSLPPSYSARSMVVLQRLLAQIQGHRASAQLLLRDLADGGGAAVEALLPTLRAAYDALRSNLDREDESGGKRAAQLMFLRLAAPLFLLTAAWPVLESALELDPAQQEALLYELLDERPGLR